MEALRTKSLKTPTFMFDPGERKVWADRLLRIRPEDLDEFGTCALELFQRQVRLNPAYRAFLEANDLSADKIPDWRHIPAIPQTLFKAKRIASHPKHATTFTFLSSGTTGSKKSEHHLLALDIYEAVCSARVPFFAASPPSISSVAGSLAGKWNLQFLTASAEEAPHSSLSRMFSFWRDRMGTKGSQFWIKKDQIDLIGLRRKLEQAIASQRPVTLMGTAFAFVHLIDAWKGSPLILPGNSLLLETGGFKGRTRELRKPAFYRQLEKSFGVPESNIWNEYGMCELSSQAYARGIRGEHHTPPWARVLIIDPSTNQEVNIGQKGLVRWIDLANVDSVLAIQTLDLAKRTKTGFSLIGRLPQALLRGCSLTAEHLAQVSSNG